MSLALTCAGYTAAYLKSYRGEPRGPEVMGANRKTPVKYLKGIKQFSCEKVTELTVHLRSLYTNALSIANKQELEATRLLERYDLLAITENWWDESTTGLECDYQWPQTSQKDRGVEFALYIKKRRDCEVLRKK